MTYLIAAAGTGGHVYPGLAVGEALFDHGITRESVLYVGGDRLEASVYPAAGFPFFRTELRGLKRGFSLQTLTLPAVVWRARSEIADQIGRRDVKVALGMGGYVTVPTALAASKRETTLMIAEQNAGAGLANRLSARWASRQFVSFPETEGLPTGEWVGNPVRREIADFDRSKLREEALEHYELDADEPVLGVFGGSLGAMAINEAVRELATGWPGRPFQIVHLTGQAHVDVYEGETPKSQVVWRRLGYEDRMDLFFAAIDLVVARAGGSVAEVTATSTPALLMPGEFGSSGHQASNARFLQNSRAAVIVEQADVAGLQVAVENLLFDARSLMSMREGATGIARPRAAADIAEAMIEAASP